MKRKLLSLAALISAIFVFTSCLNSDNEVTTYYGDTAITSFSVGTLKYYKHTTSSTGKDSVYQTTLSCSGYKFYIDQSKGEIYNPDSLPYGIDGKKVLCTVSSKNSGSIVIKSLTSDSLAYYSSTDSMNFTTPREFRVYNQEGTAYRKYTVHVNVHKEVADSFRWDATSAINDNIAALSAMKGVALNSQIFLMGNSGGVAKLYSTSQNSVSGWNEITPNIVMSTDAYKSLIVKDDYIYTYNSGSVIRSKDGISWETVSNEPLTRLVGCTSAKMYALSGSGIKISLDGGVTWTVDVMEDALNLLPTDNVNMFSFASPVNDNTNNLVLVGNRDASFTSDAYAMVWGKVEENAAGSENQPWAYYNITEENKYPAPRLTNLQTVKYGDAIMAFGGSGLGLSTEKAFNKFYMSYDKGITWQNDSLITQPIEFKCAAASFALVADNNNCIWLICGGSGQVWKGHINKVAWKEE